MILSSIRANITGYSIELRSSGYGMPNSLGGTSVGTQNSTISLWLRKSKVELNGYS